MSIIENLMKKCKFCGDDFRSTIKRRAYCSDGCFDGSVKERQKKYREDNKKELYKRKTTCKYCNNKFKTEELKERCCDSGDCLKEKKKEKQRTSWKKHYNKNIKKATKKFKKKDAESSRNYRQTHVAEINKRSRALKKEKREWVNSLKKNKICSKCGEDRWFCLEYHHINPENKKFTISNAISGGYGKESILKEIEKCILLCGNCHEHFHYLGREMENWEPSKEWLNNKEVHK